MVGPAEHHGGHVHLLAVGNPHQRGAAEHHVLDGHVPRHGAVDHDRLHGGVRDHASDLGVDGQPARLSRRLRAGDVRLHVLLVRLRIRLGRPLPDRIPLPPGHRRRSALPRGHVGGDARIPATATRHGPRLLDDRRGRLDVAGPHLRRLYRRQLQLAHDILRQRAGGRLLHPVHPAGPTRLPARFEAFLRYRGIRLHVALPRVRGDRILERQRPVERGRLDIGLRAGLLRHRHAVPGSLHRDRIPRRAATGALEALRARQLQPVLPHPLRGWSGTHRKRIHVSSLLAELPGLHRSPGGNDHAARGSLPIHPVAHGRNRRRPSDTQDFPRSQASSCLPPATT